jgi:fucose permease
MPGSQALLITVISAALAVGLILRLPMALRPQLAAHMGGDDRRARLLRLVFILALIPMHLVAGFLVDSWGVQEGLIIGALGTAVGLASLGLSREFRQALGAVALLGAALAVLHTATAALMPQAFDRDLPTTAACLGYVFVGLGTAGAITFLPWLVRHWGLRHGLLGLALVYLVPAGAAGFTSPQHFPAQATGQMTTIFAEPSVWLAALVVFLYLPLETLVLAWAPTFLGEVGRSPEAVPVVLVGYWLAFLASRLLMAVALPVLVPWLMLILIVLAAVVVGNLSGSNQPTGGALGLLLLGACLGPIFPSLVGVVFLHFGHHLALAFGLVMAVGSAGSLLWQPPLEHFILRQPVRPTLRLVMVAVLVSAAPALVLCLLL